ncbi:endonuclease/exonuclease/phosphatase family protein [Psychromarinibacter halotolerans]|uniref:Endonuclease/exonuclease/phosphatase family protein n=1 Tax=Psychromarinibacter halotolerans TaxID=1775175 RepID=A0ABV7GXU3_9RHOB|nr:endonuclease/exonuclease/phosphatase family protein [Psychromarinibacter halotolerans]MDF0598008.1 endonuclease [Psychromarinibacter halotolerans]
MRIATYNVEWFNSLFDDANGLLEDDGWSSRRDVTRADQLGALGIVFTAMNADAVLVVEAPDTVRDRSTVAALEAFAARYDLRTRKALLGFSNQTQQEIALLYDPDVLTAAHDPWGAPSGKRGGQGLPRFDGTFRLDLDTDAAPEPIVFSKPPLEAALRTKGGRALRLIGVHVKSKAPHGATNPDQVMRISIENRRKQLAQCVWLRRRVDEVLQEGEDLIVLGDFNDGPGLDEYEKLFGRSGVEIVLGDDDGRTPLYDPHAHMALSQRVGAMPSTARFYIQQEERYLSALLDYVMVSPRLRRRDPRWRIWHPFDDPVCYRTPELREALLTASDHFPVSLDLDLS